MPIVVRRLLLVAYATYLMAVAYLVWAPSPAAPGSAVKAVAELTARLGVPIGPHLAEFGLNVVMLLPLGLLGGLLWRGLSVSDWTLIGFLASFAIEVVQRLALASRSGSTRDIVANTLGALLGAAVLSTALQVHRGRIRDSSDRTSSLT